MKENKLIAEFMGFPKQSDVVDERTTAYYIGDLIKANNENNQNEDDVFHPEDMLFDSSWDWLMPVVQKIKDIPTYEGYDSIDFVLNCDLTIENLYDSVVEFINEYNK